VPAEQKPASEWNSNREAVLIGCALDFRANPAVALEHRGEGDAWLLG
jgi:hypothetical protein